MTRRRRRWRPAAVAGSTAAAVAVVVGAVSISHGTATTGTTTPPPAAAVSTSTAPPAAPSAAPTSCTIIDGRADARCTPGVRNPAVTQDTIGATICTPGWTDTIRPPQSYTDQLKRQQMPVYGLTGPLSAVEEDHLLSLELGGAPTAPANLWPEPRTGPRGATAKDALETRLKTDICAHRVTLAAAQQQWLTDWTHP